MQKETMKLLEEQVQDSIKCINENDLESKERRVATAEACQLLDRLITAEHDQMEFWDKEDRRRIEEERNLTMKELEQDKNEITPLKAGFEMAKVVVPLVLQIGAFFVGQKRMIKFEETGRFTSSVSRELHLPKIFK